MIGLIAYAVIVVGLSTALWRYPAVALAGVLCMFGLEQWGQANVTFFAQHQTATNYLVGVILVLALTIQAMRKGFSILAGYPLIGWLTVILFLYAFVSTQWAPRTDISQELWANRWPYLITFLVLSPLIITETRDLRSAYTALVLIGGTLSILLLFFVKWEARRIVLTESLGDPSFGNPLAVSAMAGMVVLSAILADPWPGSKLWFPIKWVIVTLCLTLVVRSGSRGQLFGVVVLSMLCWPISRGMGNPKQLITWILLLSFFSGVMIWTLHTFWSEPEAYYAGGNRWSDEAMQGAMSGRFEQVMILLRFWSSSPENVFFGLGNSASFDPRILGIYPHLVPLEILAEEGLIGFTFFLSILLVAVTNGLRCYRYVRAVPSERPIFALLIALSSYALLLALKQGSMLGNLELFMFGIILTKYTNYCSPTAYQEGQSEAAPPWNERMIIYPQAEQEC